MAFEIINRGGNTKKIKMAEKNGNNQLALSILSLQNVKLITY